MSRHAQTMANPDAHTRLIGWLKIILPLAGLALLSTLFLVARTVDPELAIPYADVDVKERLQQPRMTQPAYAGVTSDGAALTLAAAEARPDAKAQGSGTATALSGTLETPDGTHSELHAGAARIDDGERKIFLSDGVTISQSNGWVVRAAEMTALMDRTEVTSKTPVTATGPAGTLDANSLVLTENLQKPGHYVLVFKGAVKLIYRPAN